MREIAINVSSVRSMLFKKIFLKEDSCFVVTRWCLKVVGSDKLRECLTVACKAFSLANAKEKGTDGLVIRSLDD